MVASVRLLSVLLLLAIPHNVLAQDVTRTGFAIVTLTSGNTSGLVATESLVNVTSRGLEHAVVGASPLVTSASILAPAEPFPENATGIAIANPSTGAGGVSLSLTDQSGALVAQTVIQLGPLSHISRYVHELLGTPAALSGPLLLTMSSEIPVAVLALNSRSGDLASIPLTSLAAPVAVPVLTSTEPATTAAPPTFAFGIGFFPPGPTPGFGLGVSPTAPATGVFVTPAPGPTTATFGGSAALVFPLVAAGGAWFTEVSIGNTSSALQVIRIDFFRDGVNTRSIVDIVVPPRGVFFLQTTGLFGAVLE